MKDDLGDRMKGYEGLRTKVRLDQPFTYARIDGRGFSKFTKGFVKPFDHSFSNLMIDTTELLVEKTHAIAGYVQSDEISLLWRTDKVFFDAKIQKLSSILSSMAASIFITKGLTSYESLHSNILDKIPHFDARVFDLPDEDEATNTFYWRYRDCYRNAIQGIAQSKFSHKELNKKNLKDQELMLSGIGVSKFDYPDYNVHGTFFNRKIEYIVGRENEIVERNRVNSSSLDFSGISHDERKDFIMGNNG